MKTLVFALSLLMLPILTQAQEKIQTVDIKTEIFCDHCAVCASCGKNIYDHIKSNKGVRKVEILAETNVIQITYNTEKTSLSKLEKAISLAGYRANDIPADANGYDKLEACCKKL